MDAMQRLVDLNAVARLRARDSSLFGDDAESLELAASRLGWTDLAERASTLLTELERLAVDAAEDGVTDVVLLGMGGSSLAALVLAETLGQGSDRRLHVLDTTEPHTVGAALADLDPAKTLYVVSSKSGGTIEPNSLYAVFREVADIALGAEQAGSRFIAITDPGSSLEGLAGSAGFRTLVSAPPAVGGRFSALSAFGLAPAALAGIDVDELVERAAAMEAAMSVPAAENPAAILAAFIDDALRAGKDKLTIVASEPLRSFGLWAEQLVAESLGKEGMGVVPVVELSDDFPQGYGPDRAIVAVRLEDDQRLAEWLERLGHHAPLLELTLRDLYDIGAEWVRWEHAIALVGALMSVNPFGQPDVASAKAATSAALDGTLEVPAAETVCPDGVCLTFAGALGAPTHAERSAATALGHAIASMRESDYLAVLAYLPYRPDVLAPLEAAVPPVSAILGSAITLELGPRYLHSTGQLHKGGPDNAVFIVVTTRDAADVPVPGRPWGLRTLFRAQAEGDLATLASAGRRVLRIDLPDSSAESVALVAHALESAAGVVWES